MRIRVFLAVLIFAPTYAFACELTAENFPKFQKDEYSIPIFEGTECSRDEWKKYRRKILAFRNIIREYDEERVSHDVKVRSWDLKLENRHRNGSCTTEEYLELKTLVDEANRQNRGPRIEKWRLAQLELSEYLKEADDKIKKFSQDLGSDCS